MRHCILIIIFSFVCCQSLFAEHSSNTDLELLIEEAIVNNPKIKAAYNTWQAEHYKIRYVSSLPDPMLKFGYFGESIETRVGPQKYKYGVSQTIPFPGKLSLRGKTQSKQAEMLMEKYQAVRRNIIREIKFVYYDIYWIDKAIEITEQEKTVLESLEAVARKKYEANLTSQQDVVKVQLELSKLLDKVLILERNRKSLIAKLNSILNRSGAGVFSTIFSISVTEFGYDLEQLLNYAQENRQELKEANLNVARAEYEKSLAKMNYVPDVTVGFEYIDIGDGYTSMVDDGQNAWLGTVALNFPIWFTRVEAELNEKNAKLTAAQYSYEDINNNIEYEVEDLYYKIDTYENIIDLYEGALLPQAEQAFNMSRTGYESGKVDFLDWLDSERILLQTRLAYQKSIVDYQKSIAYLERIVGKDL